MTTVFDVPNLFYDLQDAPCRSALIVVSTLKRIHVVLKTWKCYAIGVVYRTRTVLKILLRLQIIYSLFFVLKAASQILRTSAVTDLKIRLI